MPIRARSIADNLQISSGLLTPHSSTNLGSNSDNSFAARYSDSESSPPGAGDNPLKIPSISVSSSRIPLTAVIAALTSSSSSAFSAAARACAAAFAAAFAAASFCIVAALASAFLSAVALLAAAAFAAASF